MTLACCVTLDRALDAPDERAALRARAAATHGVPVVATLRPLARWVESAGVRALFVARFAEAPCPVVVVRDAAPFEAGRTGGPSSTCPSRRAPGARARRRRASCGGSRRRAG